MSLIVGNLQGRFIAADFFSRNDKWRNGKKRLVGVEHIKTKSFLLPMLPVSRSITKKGDIQNI